MFSDKSFDVEGFTSCWKTERVVTDVELQTPDFSCKEQESQVKLTACAETQTETNDEQLKMMSANYVDEDKLAAFLRKVTPRVISELGKAERSRAFQGYESLEDVSDGVVKKLLDLQPIVNIVTKEMKITCLSWSCTGAVVAVGYGQSEHNSWCDHPSSVFLYNVNTQGLSAASPSKVLECSSCVSSLSAHPLKPAILAAGTYSGEIVVWNLQRDDDCLLCSSASLQGSHKEAVSQVCWVSSQQKTRLVSAGHDGRILVWKVKTHSRDLHLVEGFTLVWENIKYLGPNKVVPSPAGSSNIGMELGVTCISFSPFDSTSFIVGVDGGALLLCSTITAKPAPVDAEVPLKDPVMKAFDKHQGSVTCVEFSSHWEGKFVSCGIDKEIRIYHITQSSPLQVFYVETGMVGLEWSKAQPHVIAFWGSASGCIHFYNTYTGEEIPSMQIQASEKQCPISVARCNPQSTSLIATGDESGRLVVWKQALSIPG